MNKLRLLKSDLRKESDPEKAKFHQKFFKTYKGGYGEGDLFLGVTVPNSRKIAKKYKGLSLSKTTTLLKSKYHEERLIALFILTHQFQKGDDATQKEIYDLYLSHTKYINNWDLVDASAHKITGPYLLDRNRKTLHKLAKSKSLWERRIAIISTYHFIRLNQFEDTISISKTLLFDEHDLIHKAVGWMLREVGKRDQKVEEEFLKRYYQKMPRTMLRYAIEKFPEKLRQQYLKGVV